MNTDLYKSSSTDDQFDMMLMFQMDKLCNEPSNMMSFSGNSSYDGNNPDVSLPFPYSMIRNSNLSYPASIPAGGNGNGKADRNCWSPIQSSSTSSSSSQQKQTSMAAMREMIFRIAAMQPIYIDPESVKPPKRRNVRISKDPQSVAARHRRERISERIRILQRLVPGGTKMDTASMLDEAIHYVKFLKSQVQTLERASVNNPRPMQPVPVGFPVAVSNRSGIFPVTGGKGISSGYGMSSQVAPTTTQYVQQFSDDS